MRLTLVRHAESSWNVTGQWQGHADVALSPRGQLQARALAGRLFARSFTHRISSDLMRARDTAGAVGEVDEVDPRWREIDVGEWEGLTRGEVAEEFPDQVAGLRGGENVRIGGGESMEEFEARVDGALDELRGRFAGEDVLVVTHGGVIRAIVSRVLGTRGRMSPLVGAGNTSITRLTDEGGELRLRVYNDGWHLDPGDQASSIHAASMPNARLALVATAPDASPDRATADAILAGLGIAQYYALGDAQASALTEHLVADPLESLDLDDLRARHHGGSMGLALPPGRVAPLVSHALEIGGPGALVEPPHGAVSLLRLFDARAELFSFGVRLGGG